MASKEMNDLPGGITDTDIQGGASEFIFYLFQKDDHRRRYHYSVHQLRGVCKKGPVVDVYFINTKGPKLIERGRAESQAMMVMNDDPGLTNYETHTRTNTNPYDTKTNAAG